MNAEQNKGQPSRIPSLAEALHEVEFPISRDELLHQYGDVKIQWAEGRVQTLETVLGAVEQAEFKSVSDIAMVIGEITKT